MSSKTSRPARSSGPLFRRTTLPVLFALGSALIFSGCFSMATPDGFLTTDESGYQIKAVSSDSTLLWVRIFKDRYDGDLPFWTDALYNDLVEHRGYTLKEKKAIRAGDLDGEEMLFETTAAGATQQYLVSLFVKDGLISGKICVVEFVGSDEAFEVHLEAVRAAVKTIRF